MTDRLRPKVTPNNISLYRTESTGSRSRIAVSLIDSPDASASSICSNQTFS